MKRRIPLLVLMLSLLAGSATWRAVRTQAAPFAVIRVPANQPTIQAGVDAAQPGDTVEVEPGTYTGPGNRSITVNKAITVRCRTGNPDDCIVDVNTGLTGNTGFNFGAANVVSVLEGFTIKRGTGFFFIAGGLLISDGARPVIRNCKILENIAINDNGGVLVENAFPEFSNCLIADNLGNGMKVVGTSIATISDCTFSGNTRDGLRVGAAAVGIFSEAVGKPTAILNNCRFEGNQQSGLKVTSIVPDSNPSAMATGSVFTGNNDSGVNAFGADTVSLTNCSLLFNTSFNGGGGLQVSLTRKVALTNSLVVGNRVTKVEPTAAQATALLMLFPQELTLTNNTITGHANSAMPTTYLAPNFTPNAPGPFKVTNTIIWGNNSSIDIFSSTAPGYPAITVSACDTQRGMTGVADGGGNLSVDPLFVRNALTNNAADAGDLRLQSTSPVKDRGTLAGLDLNLFPKDANGNLLDYAANPRLTCDGLIDLGAYENQTLTGSIFTVGIPTATASIGQTYSSSVVATPTAPTGFSYRYSLANGTTLPGGLALNSSTGAITGTPDTSGSVNFSIKVELLNPGGNPTACSNTQTRTINVTCPTITVGTPATATFGQSYSSSVATSTAAPGGFKYQYTLANGTALPAGLALNSNTGAITGTPLVSGNFSFAIKADLLIASNNAATGCNVTQTRSISIACASSIEVTNLNDSGLGSLRTTIAGVCAGETITFQNGLTGTIMLTSGELVIGKNLTIQGPGANLLAVQRSTVSGTPDFRIFKITAGDVTLTGLTIANGKANFGSGIYNQSTGTVNVTSSMLSGNSAEQGGGIYSTGLLHVTSSTLANNMASGSGGYGAGIYNAGQLEVRSSTLSGNTIVAGDGLGGGIYNASQLTVTNSTLSGNTISATPSFGGGIYNLGTTKVVNSTISGNTLTSSQSFGGGISSNSGTVTTRNTIIAGNTASRGPDARGDLTSQGYNLLGKSDDSTGLTNNVNNDQVGTIAMPLDAKLALLGNYGGPSQTLRPLPGSPAINAGNNCVTETPGCLTTPLTTDQRGAGFDRKVGSAVDIGAFETNYILAATGGTPQSAVVNTNFTTALQVTLTESSQPISGVQVTFSAPSSGASATFPNGNTATTDTQGRASVNVTANSLTGSYQVSASVPRLTANFSLTNQCATITVSGVPPVNPTCFGGTNGSLTVQASGGIAPLQYSINNGQSFQASNVFLGLGAGSYQVVAKDANGCLSNVFPVTLTQPMAVTFSVTPVAPSCNGSANGGLTINAMGGTGAFQYSINGGSSFQPSPGFSGLAAGTYAVVVKDANGCFGAQQNFTLTQPAALGLSPAALPGAVAGQFFTQTFTASGGTGNRTLTLNSTLPNWLNFNAQTSSLSGTPPEPGTVSFSITVTDQNNCALTQSYSLTVVCPAVTLSPVSLPDASVNTAYPATLSANPAGGNYSFALTSGLLPAGLTLNSNGSFSGAPANSGTFNFRVTATGFGTCSIFRDYVLTVNCPAITVNPASVPSGNVGVAYNQTVSALPGGAYSYSVTSGALPTGLMLNAATGAITGFPTASGTFNFRIVATAGTCSGSRDYTVTINCASLTITTSTLPAGTAGSAYSQTINVTPAGSYTFSLLTGSLPSGLTLNPTSGALSGLPTVTGSYSFTIKAQAASGCSGTQSYSLNVGCPSITLSTLATPTLNTLYSQTITASPAGGVYSYAVTVGALPAGFALNPATGSVSGTPTVGGAYSFTITATGFGACTGSRAYSGTIEGGGCPTITLSDLPGGQPGQLYTNAVTASPNGTYSYAVTSGSLPAGLTLYGSFGLVYGYPTAAGTFTFTITATDANNCTGSRSYSLLIGGAATQSLVLGDFDGDGKADLSVWRGASGDWLTVNSGDGKLKTEAWGSSAAPYFDVMTPGDYDGDGKMDLAVFRKSTGEWLIKSSRDAAITSKVWGLGTDVPVPGDYDGDGKTDIAVWRGADTNWYILQSSDQQTKTVSWGTSRAPYRDVAVPADYDGDGKTDIAVFRQSDGHWYIRLSSSNEIVDKTWGLGTDVPVAADYDGDGKADLAVWRAADTNWYVLRSSDDAVQSISWGTSSLGDVPVPGDYDGDGKADVAVWRTSDGHWYARRSRDNSVLTKAHGQSGDSPALAKSRP